MLRLISVASAVLAVAVAALTMQVYNAQKRITALEQAPPAAAQPARADRERGQAAERADDDADPGARFFPARRPGAVGSAAAPPQAPGAAAAAGSDAEEEAEGRVPDLVRSELKRIDDERQQAREERQRARVDRELDALKDDAKLSDDQRAQLGTMLQAELVEMRQLFADARDSGEWSGLRDKLRAVRDKTDENADAVLDDDDQRAAFQKMRDDERSRFLGGRSGRSAAGGNAN